MSDQMMGSVDPKMKVPARIFSRALEELLGGNEGEEKQLWAVYHGGVMPSLEMVNVEESRYWQPGTVIHLEWMQWVAIRREGELAWTDVHGRVISHEQMMDQASGFDADDRRIIMWLDNGW
jgi:hypothetical protein